MPVEDTTGARTLTRAEAIRAAVTFEVLETRAANSGVELVEGFGSEAEHPLHIAGLRAEGNAVMLDADGFATPLRGGADTVEIPANAKVRVTMNFDGDPSRASKLRLWGTELDVPSAANEAPGTP